jgi:hypothetical protein
MAVSIPCLCTREDVKRATDIKETARNNWQIDRAIQSATENIEDKGHLHRKFYPVDATYYFDWPNFQYAYPWRLWLDQYNLATQPVAANAVTSGGQTIPLAACNFEPVNSGPPYTYLELRRDLSYSFGVGQTPQRDIAITGTWGYWMATDPAGTLTAAVSTTTATNMHISDGSLIGIGQLLIVDSERMLIADRATLDTGQTNLSGATTADMRDVSIGVTDGTQLHIDEVIQIDSERMLVADITGNAVTVKRAWDGTVLAAHAAGTHVYAFRSLTVVRGMNGTTAATHNNGAAATVWRIPSLLRDLAIAEASVRVSQEIGGYSDPEGEGASAVKSLGAALPELWDEAETRFGRKARIRGI